MFLRKMRKKGREIRRAERENNYQMSNFVLHNLWMKSLGFVLLIFAHVYLSRHFIHNVTVKVVL